MAEQERDHITTHVLDTMTGDPARAVHVYLTLRNPAPSSEGPTTFEALTNSDGRVTVWASEFEKSSSLKTIFDEAFGKASSEQKRTVLEWTMSFHVEDYFGSIEQRTFWDKIDVNFKTIIGGEDRRTHWHIPVLLSPYSYTTYRGS